MATATNSTTGHDMQQCIDECTHCHQTCLSAIRHCLDQGGDHAASNHIGLLLDCAEICQTSANFMLRGSQRHQETCGACARICRACEHDCRQMGIGDDSMMQQCAEACSNCAASCERMANM